MIFAHNNLFGFTVQGIISVFFFSIQISIESRKHKQYTSIVYPQHSVTHIHVKWLFLNVFSNFKVFFFCFFVESCIIITLDNLQYWYI